MTVVEIAQSLVPTPVHVYKIATARVDVVIRKKSVKKTRTVTECAIQKMPSLKFRKATEALSE